MWEKEYLLDLSDLMAQPEDTWQIAVKEKLEALLDQERLLKYQSKRQEKSAMQSLGAGVLLQLAVKEYREGQTKDSQSRERQTEGTKIYTPEDLLERLTAEDVSPLRYRYGTQGKPYFRDIPLYFSLSHSENLVCLSVSEQEVGADIQKITGANWMSIARRFYTVSEIQRLELESTMETQDGKTLFFTLWAEKEAYAKMTGEGVAQVLGEEVTKLREDLLWKYKCLRQGENDFVLVICKKREVPASV